MDILKEYGPESWVGVLADLKAGYSPDPKQVASLLRIHEVIPGEVREFLASQIEKQGFLKNRGAQPISRTERTLRAVLRTPLAKQAIEEEMAKLSADDPDGSDFYTAALEKLTDIGGAYADMTEAQLDKLAYPRRGRRKQNS